MRGKEEKRERGKEEKENEKGRKNGGLKLFLLFYKSMRRFFHMRSGHIVDPKRKLYLV